MGQAMAPQLFGGLLVMSGWGEVQPKISLKANLLQCAAAYISNTDGIDLQQKVARWYTSSPICSAPIGLLTYKGILTDKSHAFKFQNF